MGMQDADDLDPLPFLPIDHQMRPAGMDAHRRREFLSRVGHLGKLRQQVESGGWVEVMEGGALITLRGKTGWREVEIARGSSDQTCPVHALAQWLHFARIDFGPIFVAVSRNGARATGERLSDKHVARLIKQPSKPPACAPICQRPNGWRFTRATRCAPALPAAPRWTSATSRNSLATPAPKGQVPRQPHQGRGAVTPLPF